MIPGQALHLMRLLGGGMRMYIHHELDSPLNHQQRQIGLVIVFFLYYSLLVTFL